MGVNIQASSASCGRGPRGYIYIYKRHENGQESRYIAYLYYVLPLADLEAATAFYAVVIIGRGSCAHDGSSCNHRFNCCSHGGLLDRARIYIYIYIYIYI